MCGVKDLSVELSKKKLRWFRHEKSGRRGVEQGGGGEGRPKKRWRECVMEDMNLLGIDEHMAQDHQLWKAVITCPTPP
ncbi:hypothetical protein E2C01_021013 [Portunus trituberculatus]|uniref:Uncharacterized protein n=1 Tax=Portunus trituberculatus TaxID=210409 RepID=A0A5B7E339_PORTR|nr:hypothetical protein [Portunus trituberculatus]